MGTEKLSVEPERSTNDYEIRIGNNLLDYFAEELTQIKLGCQVFLVSNDIIYNIYGLKIKNSLLQQGFQVLEYCVPDGEEYKTWQQAGEMLTTLMKAGFNRDAVVVALGGGVIGDLAGFVASVYERGIDLIQLPTSLLAQVDSSIGGKVAVNHPLGKNMIGAFYQPLGVWTDLETLRTLPDREWKAGLGEVVKYGVIWDEKLFNLLENNIDRVNKREMTLVRQLIIHSCRIKAEVVSQDEKEKGLRTILNFGHTMGHVLEKLTSYKVYRHGEAVAIGMVWATKIAVTLKLCPQELQVRLEKVLRKIGLPVNLPNVNPEDVLKSIYLDKKVTNKELVLVLPKKIGQVEVVKGITSEVIKQSLI